MFCKLRFATNSVSIFRTNLSLNQTFGLPSKKLAYFCIFCNFLKLPCSHKNTLRGLCAFLTILLIYCLQDIRLFLLVLTNQSAFYQYSLSILSKLVPLSTKDNMLKIKLIYEIKIIFFFHKLHCVKYRNFT